MNEWILIGGMMALTFGPRYLPMALAGKFHIPPLMRQALGYVPIAVLSAIIAQTSFIREDAVNFSTDNPYLYGVLVAFAASLLVKRLFPTIFAGLAAYTLAFILI